MKYKAIQNYLVSLGYRVDKVSLNSVLQAFGVTDAKAQALAKSFAKYTGTAAALTTALFGTSAAALKLVNSVAKSDLEIQRFSRQMYTTYDNAKSFLAVLDQMGLSMQDIAYMTPEEYARFKELRQFYESAELPTDYRQTLQGWREAYTEVNKFRLLMGKLKNYIAYSIVRASGKTIEQWRQQFARLNEYIRTHMDTIGQKVGRVVDVVIRLTNSLITLGRGILSLFDNAIGKTALLVGGGAALVKLFATSPLFRFLSVLLLILGVIDDIATWKRGGKSLIGELLGDYENFDFKAGIINSFNQIIDAITNKVEGTKWFKILDRLLHPADYSTSDVNAAAFSGGKDNKVFKVLDWIYRNLTMAGLLDRILPEGYNPLANNVSPTSIIPSPAELSADYAKNGANSQYSAYNVITINESRTPEETANAVVNALSSRTLFAGGMQ